MTCTCSVKVEGTKDRLLDILSQFDKNDWTTMRIETLMGGTTLFKNSTINSSETLETLIQKALQEASDEVATATVYIPIKAGSRRYSAMDYFSLGDEIVQITITRNP